MNPWNEINTSAVKGILCDLDDTLYSYDPCNKAGFEACKAFALNEYSIGNVQFENFWKLAREKVHQEIPEFAAGHSRLLYALKLSEFYFGKLIPEFVLAAEEVYWSHFIDHMVWNTSAEIFLLQASEKGKKICIVTDLTTQIQLRKWIKLDLGRFAQFMVTSEEAGYEKPNPRIFKLALEKLNLKEHEVIMIGDSKSKDIEGATALGIKSYHIKIK